MGEGVLDDELAEIERRTEREFDDRLGVDGAGIDRAGATVGLGQELQEIGFDRPQRLVEQINAANLLVGELAADRRPFRRRGRGY
jgi:hypothetical protein